MTEELVKKAYELAENELKDKQIAEVKKIVVKTLEKINNIDKEITNAKEKVKELEEEKKILKMDITDLKEGRVDRIAERQEKDEKAKAISVVVIIKEKETIIERPIPHPYWYWPYQVIWHYETPTIYCDATTTTYGMTCNAASATMSYTSSDIPINCSVAKFATIGTYNVDGEIVNLR